MPAEDLESLDLGWNPIDEKGFEAWEGLRVAGSSKRRLKLSLYESLVAHKLQTFWILKSFLWKLSASKDAGKPAHTAFM